MDLRMFDFSEYYDKIAHWLPDNCRIIEVGVANGASASYLAKKLQTMGKPFKMFWVDGMQYGGYEQYGTIRDAISEYLLDGDVSVMPMNSLDASCKFNDKSLDFVFLDSSHEYEQTKAEIRLWQHKLKDGGILAGHDYNQGEGIGVFDAVNEIVPREITREPIEGQTFEPEQFLYTYETGSGFGVWEFTKRFYYTIK